MLRISFYALFGVVVFIVLLACHSAKKALRDNNVIPAEYEKIYTDVQRTTFQYFWDGAEPNSGLARERFHVDGEYPQNDKNVVTSGGGGFGVMAILVGIKGEFRCCFVVGTSYMPPGAVHII